MKPHTVDMIIQARSGILSRLKFDSFIEVYRIAQGSMNRNEGLCMYFIQRCQGFQGAGISIRTYVPNPTWSSTADKVGRWISKVFTGRILAYGISDSREGPNTSASNSICNLLHKFEINWSKLSVWIRTIFSLDSLNSQSLTLYKLEVKLLLYLVSRFSLLLPRLHWFFALVLCTYL